MKNVSHPTPHSSSGANITSLLVEVGDKEPRKITVTGRDAWALDQLMRAGKTGCTPITNPAPRWSHYIWKLRGEGIDIETIDEPHGGAYRGTHARYVLRSKVRKILATYGDATRRAA